VGAHPHAADAAGGKLELAYIVARHGAAFRATHQLSRTQARALHAIEACRTPALGGQLLQCDHCLAQHYRYHSCRNRHCPKCQTLAKERWLAARRAELLPVTYFHLVFTLPHELNPLAQGNPGAIYALLFTAAADTLLEFGRNPRWLGGEIAATLLLHTWSQTLIHHPHVHALIPGGALASDGRWIRPRGGFLFPVQALSGVFRGKFLDALSQLLQQAKLKLAGSTAALNQPRAQRAFVGALRAHAWVVYAKASLAGPDKVLDYLARYTHKTAISNHRLLSADEHSVRFAYRDRAKDNRQRTMQLPAQQFLERFAVHVLPRGFVRIRHYGLLANRNKTRSLAQVASALNLPPPTPVAPESAQAFCLRLFGLDIDLCPSCGAGRLLVLVSLAPAPRSRAPP
jgi:Putative transposase/Transposase zinc-binding domain